MTELTRREQFAMAKWLQSTNPCNSKEDAESAVRCADALIAELDKTAPNFEGSTMINCDHCWVSYNGTKRCSKCREFA